MTDERLEPPIVSGFDSGSQTDAQSSQQEILPPISETSFPQSELTNAFSQISEHPRSYPSAATGKIATAAMRDKDNNLAANKVIILEKETKIEDLQTENSKLKVQVAKLGIQLSSLRKANWITSFLYIVAAFLMSIGWNQHSEGGSVIVFSIGCLMLIAGFVSPLIFSKSGDRDE